MARTIIRNSYTLSYEEAHTVVFSHDHSSFVKGLGAEKLDFVPSVRSAVGRTNSLHLLRSRREYDRVKEAIGYLYRLASRMRV